MPFYTHVKKLGVCEGKIVHKYVPTNGDISRPEFTQKTVLGIPVPMSKRWPAQCIDCGNEKALRDFANPWYDVL